MSHLHGHYAVKANWRNFLTNHFVLTSPMFNESSGLLGLSFSYHMYIPLNVFVSELWLQCWTAENGWDTLWSRSGPQQENASIPWLSAQVVVPLRARVLRFVGTTGDVAVDNVVAATITPLECLVRFGKLVTLSLSL